MAAHAAPANPPAPNPPPVGQPPPLSEQLLIARKNLIAAQAAYDAAMDLLTKAQGAVVKAQSTADQALSGKLQAQQNLDSLFDTFKKSPDGT